MELSFPVSRYTLSFLVPLGFIVSYFLLHWSVQQSEMDALQRHEGETLSEIEDLKRAILYKQKELKSLDDPEWIERQMIEKLGVIPEGYKAIYFTDGS